MRAPMPGLPAKLQILIVDDSAEDRETYRRLLGEDPFHTYEFLEAESGEEGLALYQEEGPDCVLLDYRLPDGDGLEVLGRLADDAGVAPVPVVMLTGFGAERVDIAAIAAGAQDYLAKGDVTAQLLRRTVRHAIERHQLAADRRQAEEKFRMAVEAAPNAMIIADRDGKIVLANSRTEKMFGYRWEELRGQPVEILVPDRARHAHVEQRKEFLTELRARPLGAGRDLVATRKDGSEFPVEIGLSPFTSADETFILASVTDISVRKRADEEHKLFLAATSHDVRNCLGTILGYAELLTDSPDRRAPKDAVQRIGSLVQTLSGMMNDLVLFAHVDTKPICKPVSARTLVQDCARGIEKRCRRAGLNFRLRLPPEGTVVTDAVKLTRIVQNLLGNALRYTPKGGIHVRGELTDDELRLSVRDTGIGIPEEDIERVFEPYFRHEEAKAIEALGTGLGLATVRKLSGIMGGTVSVRSKQGVGSTFTVVIPRNGPKGTGAAG